MSALSSIFLNPWSGDQGSGISNVVPLAGAVCCLAVVICCASRRLFLKLCPAPKRPIIIHRWIFPDRQVAVLFRQKVLQGEIEEGNQRYTFSVKPLGGIEETIRALQQKDPHWEGSTLLPDFQNPHFLSLWSNVPLKDAQHACELSLVKRENTTCWRVADKRTRTTSFCVATPSFVQEHEDWSPQAIQRDPSTLKISRLEFTKKTFRSLFPQKDGGTRLQVDRDTWVVSLLTLRADIDHALIAVEGVEKGEHFLKLAHLRKEKESGEGEAVTLSKDPTSFWEDVARNTSPVAVSKIQGKFILASANRQKVEFSLGGPGIIFCRGAHNCISWAVATLETVGVKIEKVRRSSIWATHPHDYIPAS